MEKGLTILSYGGGQDSTTLLLKYIYDPEFRKRFVKGHFIVIMSDTGNEHRETYKYVDKVKELCEKEGIEFYFIRTTWGYHPATWQTLESQWTANTTVGSVAFSKACTDNLKIKPIYNFVADYVNKFYLGGSSTSKRKKSLYEFREKFGKIRVMLGIAYGEEKRVAISDSEPQWSRLNVEKIFPLITLKMDRAACQKYIRSVVHEVPIPSNCIFCPYLSKQELLWLWRNYREDYDRWVIYETNKLKKHAERESNLGVFGKKTLPEVLEIAKEKYGHWSDKQLEEHKYSHGHCVASKY